MLKFNFNTKFNFNKIKFQHNNFVCIQITDSSIVLLIGEIYKEERNWLLLVYINALARNIKY